jgi:hypothetical protein
MKKPFNHSVREYLESVSLDDKQFEQLMAMQKRYIYKPTRRRRKRRLSWYKIAGFGSLLLLGVIVIIMTDFLDIIDNNANYTDKVSLSVIQRIADEVASSHLKMKPLEVESFEISEVQDYFSKLDFSPYSAQPLASNAQIALAGGRYCSIQGSKAAQLRYKDTKGGYVTLFETAYSAVLFEKLPNIDKGETPVITYTKGIKVSMWVEKEIVMVSTEKFR